ncbi:MAG: ABC transporter permease [Thermoanaerobaculia bacterium]|nr:ABC transporter permease [Thermoanaerobaculia bacterium]
MARIRGFLRPGDADGDFDEELQAHLDMAVESKIRQGLSPKEARRRARIELGNLTQLREAASERRGLPRIGSSWLDVKLGLRMLRKSWGLTLVAGLAMTVVITLAAVAFEILGLMAGTDLPLDEGDRVVAVQSWNQETGDGLGTLPEDFERWRDTLRTVEQVGAFRLVERNLQTDEPGNTTPGKAIEVAEISASGFQVARVQPALGRPLLKEDEHASADPVLVLGHVAWRQHFQADPEVLGRQVRLDGTVHTIVGVMPEEFGFPIAQHYWIPLHVGPESYAPDAGAERLFVFARLGDGVAIEQAHAELNRVGLSEVYEPAESAVSEPGLRVIPYASAFLSDIDSWMINLAVLVFMMLLLPPCVNVAILVYARTITRQEEFAARYVLGASRFHIVFQLFLEILVLAGCAGAVALGVARVAVWQLVADRKAHGELPFWMDLSLSPRTILVVVILAVFAALIAGVLPALRATGRGMQAGLKSLGGQSQQAQLGVVWTLLIVVQVAVSTALLPTSAEMVWGTVRSGLLGPGFAAERYLTAELKPGTLAEGDPEMVHARFEQRQLDLVRRLEARPEIAAVTVASYAPGDGHWFSILKEGAQEEEGLLGSPIRIGRVTQVNHVDQAFFDVFQVPILAGRSFDPADYHEGRSAVIVNRAFALDMLGEDNPIGRRIAYPSRTQDVADSGSEEWFEIVGVAADIHKHSANPAVYHPARAEPRSAVNLSIRVHTDPTNAAGVLRSATWSVDPALRLGEVRRLDEIYRQKAIGNYVGAGTLVVATLSLLLLSAAGIYSLMSFTVGRRRKEIGIRAALGASPRHIVAAVFRRALAQVAIGALVGAWIAVLVGHYLPIQQLGGWELPGIVPATAAFIAGVAFLALLGPARRGLRVEPVEELRQG